MHKKAKTTTKACLIYSGAPSDLKRMEIVRASLEQTGYEVVLPKSTTRGHSRPLLDLMEKCEMCVILPAADGAITWDMAHDLAVIRGFRHVWIHLAVFDSEKSSAEIKLLSGGEVEDLVKHHITNGASRNGAPKKSVLVPS